MREMQEFHWVDHRGQCKKVVTNQVEQFARQLSTYNYMFISYPVVKEGGLA